VRKKFNIRTSLSLICKYLMIATSKKKYQSPIFTRLLFNRLYCSLCIKTNESTAMKNSLFLILLTILFGARASINEMTVLSRLGLPVRTIRISLLLDCVRPYSLILFLFLVNFPDSFFE
jgi:hypothetical protein